MDFIFNFIAAVIGGIVVISGWILTLGKKLQVLDDVKNKVDNIERFSMSASNAIVEIQTHLTSIGYNISQRLVVTNASPTRLTDYGEQLMQETGFHKVAENNKRFLTDLVKAKNPRSNYDIQEFSLQVLKELVSTNDSIILPLKNYAYEKGLVLDIILRAAGIVLRDIVMEEIKFDDQTLEGKA